MRFIRDYLQQKKFLLKAAEVRPFNVPPYEELAVKRIFEQIKDDVRIVSYLHYYPYIKELPDHQFFYTVLGSLEPEYLSKLIKHANRAPNKRDAEEDQMEMIAIAP